MVDTPPRILFIDAYDSFSNNIISLLETTLGCSVRTVKIDNPILLASEAALLEELRHYVAVVCGPGPGHPGTEADVGIMRKIWKLRDDDLLPVLGICLGFQSLCLEFGASVGRLKGPQHGIVRKITHVREDARLGDGQIFEGVGEIKATHYQSLCVDIGLNELKHDAQNGLKWDLPAKCPDLVPLAYVESDLSVANNWGAKDERILVGVRHRSMPFWALQYHPESICTDEASHIVILNWFKHAQSWSQAYRKGSVDFTPPLYGKSAIKQSLLSQCGTNRPFSVNDEDTNEQIKPLETSICHTRTIDFTGRIIVPELLEAIQDIGGDQILLDSSNAYEKLSGTADVRGRFSIIGLDVVDAQRFEYTARNDHVVVVAQEQRMSVDLSQFGGIWQFLAQHLNKNQCKDGHESSPFWGGFMGYTTYELGLESINVESQTRNEKHCRPDMCFAWITRSLVVDHVKQVIHVQALAPKSAAPFIEEWTGSIVQKLKMFLSQQESTPPSPTSSLGSATGRRDFNDTPASTPPRSAYSSTIDLLHKGLDPTISPSIQKPSDSAYESKVIRCQEYISSGDSYELCLTDQTSVTKQRTSSPTQSWELYKTLRTRQPAPFASYIHLCGATLVSSSPERFLTWDHNNHCSLRPMKGTVRKTAKIDTLEKAKQLLDIPKERAENLMIVDLVRHDLHGICGSGNVQVPKLCVVEEYKSVFQMISVVEGQIPSPQTGHEDQRHTGIDVLAASLPPGSMTGAPKKRSCEILQGIEDRERGLYSGVVGYLDVRGRGDWSVTIRSMFKWDDEDSSYNLTSTDGGEHKIIETEKWHIGAGGAVTTLSTAVGEREEMQTKLTGTLGIFI